MKSSYTIKELIRLFLSKIWLLILVTVIGGVTGFCISKFILPLQYSSYISMYIQCYTNINDNSNENDITKSKQLINTYIQVLRSDAVMEAVGDTLMEEFNEDVLSESFSIADGKISPGSLRSALNITSVADTSAITIVATTKNPELAAAVCNAIITPAEQFTTSAIGVGSIKTIDTAKVYNAPISSNIMKNTVLGAMAGLFIIMMIILLLDYFDNTIKSSEKLSDMFDKAILGEIQGIPEPKGKKKTIVSESRVTLLDDAIPFHITEGFKAMRVNVTFALSTSEKKVFAVSSSNPTEGKSTTAANIAITFAQSGQNVLLIDGDMRKPVQNKIFRLKNRAGLSTAISKMRTLVECIQNTSVRNLYVMTSGPIPPNPSELLASKQAAEMLKILSEKFDVVIIDTPPINVVADSLNLSNSISGILMVVRYGVTTEEELKEAVNRIELAKMNLLGFVLNNIKVHHKGGYYNYVDKYEYGYGYGYGSKEQNK